MKKNISNESAGNDFREADEERVETRQQLTTYEEAAAVESVEVETNAQLLWRGMDTLPFQGMTEVLSRSYEIDTYKWIEGDKYLSTQNYSFPKVLFDVPQINNKLEYFTLFRCKGVKFSIRLNTTMFHYGALAISHVVGEGSPTIADPLLGKDPLISTRNAEQLFNNHPVLVSAMTADTVEIEVPWDLPIQWISNKTINEDGRASIIGKVFVTVLDTLKMASDAVLPVEISVFASFVDPEVQAPQAMGQSSEQKEKTDMLTQIVDGVETVTSGIQNVVSMATNVASAATLMLDKPNVFPVPTPIVPKGGFGAYHGYGADLTAHMSLHPDSKTSMDPSLSTVGLNPQIKSIVQTPGYYDNFQITTANSVGTRVSTYYVNPFKFRAIGTDSYLPTYCGYLANGFRFWRGSVVFHFHVFASKFTSTRLRVAFFPNYTSTVEPPTTAPGGDLPSRVIDITGDTQFSIQVPYVAESVFKPVSGFRASPASEAKGSTGVLVIDVVNPIVSSVPNQKVGVYVWQSMGPDAQFAQYVGFDRYREFVPKLELSAYASGSSDSIAQGQSAVRADPTTLEQIIPFKATELFGFADSEQYDDYVSLGKRYTSFNYNEPFNEIFVPNIIVGGTDDNGTPRYYPTPSDLVWLIAPFRWNRGSLRYRLFFNKPAVRVTSTLVGSTFTVGTSKYVEAGQPQCEFSVTLPYFSEVTYHRCLANATVDKYFYSIKPGVSSVDGTEVTIDDIMSSFGDDFGFSGLYSPPILIPRPPPTAPGSDTTSGDTAPRSLGSRKAD